ncbi:A24 family peptidase [Vibrio fluvialis]|nr:A24 family peptidase [Vibrio fluvialis]
MIPVFAWCLLVIVGVSDAKEHRIPNALVMVLLVMSVMQLTMVALIETQPVNLADYILGFALALVIGLILYILRVVSAGDVKLMAVLGVLIGNKGLIDYAFYVGIVILVVGPMYWALNRLHKEAIAWSKMYPMSILGASVALYRSGEQLKNAVMTTENLTYMPLAPILVIALAMQDYFSH